MYRSVALNTAIGGSETSQHLRGQAMDLDALPPYDNKDLFKYVIHNLDFDQIVWEFGTNECPQWVHISYKPKGNRKKRTQATSGGYIPFNLNI